MGALKSFWCVLYVIMSVLGRVCSVEHDSAVSESGGCHFLSLIYFVFSMAQIRLVFWNVDFFLEFIVRRIRMNDVAMYYSDSENDCRLTGYWSIMSTKTSHNPTLAESASGSLHPTQNIKNEQLNES